VLTGNKTICCILSHDKYVRYIMSRDTCYCHVIRVNVTRYGIMSHDNFTVLMSHDKISSVMLHDENLSQRIILLHIVSRKTNDGMFRKNGNYLGDFCSSSGRAIYFGIRHFGSLVEMTDVPHVEITRGRKLCFLLTIFE
jgi:hypothetical protein